MSLSADGIKNPHQHATPMSQQVPTIPITTQNGDCNLFPSLSRNQARQPFIKRSSETVDCQDLSFKTNKDMHVEAETIAQQLRSPSLIAQREGLERLRCDVFSLNGADVLRLSCEVLQKDKV